MTSGQHSVGGDQRPSTERCKPPVLDVVQEQGDLERVLTGISQMAADDLAVRSGRGARLAGRRAPPGQQAEPTVSTASVVSGSSRPSRRLVPSVA